MPWIRALNVLVSAGGGAFGKDLFAMNYLIKTAMEKPGVYLHCFPNYNQAKRAIWKSVHTTHEGESISYLDHIPPELIKRKNSSEMTIELINGSIYAVMGLDGKNAQRARGMNPSFVILSEYAFMDPESWRTLEPRVMQNKGTAIFISTPNGQNHFYDLYNYAQTQRDTWYSSIVTVEDANTLSEADIDRLRGEGVPEDFIQQEYYCSFKRGAEGSYYGKQIQQARDEGRLCAVSPALDMPVYTSWDIGIGDSTSIWFYQFMRNGNINVLDYYENQGTGLEHYVNYLNNWRIEKKISWGNHYVPHDMANREFSSGDQRVLTARSMGIDMTIVKAERVEVGIQEVRSILPRCVFDAKKCEYGVKCLDFYRKKWNDSLKVYYDEPLHDKYSHGADAFRMLAMGIKQYGESTGNKLNKDKIDDMLRRNMGVYR